VAGLQVSLDLTWKNQLAGFVHPPPELSESSLTACKPAADGSRTPMHINAMGDFYVNLSGGVANYASTSAHIILLFKTFPHSGRHYKGSLTCCN